MKVDVKWIIEFNIQREPNSLLIKVFKNKSDCWSLLVINKILFKNQIVDQTTHKSFWFSFNIIFFNFLKYIVVNINESLCKVDNWIQYTAWTKFVVNIFITYWVAE